MIRYDNAPPLIINERRPNVQACRVAVNDRATGPLVKAEKLIGQIAQPAVTLASLELARCVAEDGSKFVAIYAWAVFHFRAAWLTRERLGVRTAGPSRLKRYRTQCSFDVG